MQSFPTNRPGLQKESYLLLQFCQLSGSYHPDLRTPYGTDRLCSLCMEQYVIYQEKSSQSHYVQLLPLSKVLIAVNVFPFLALPLIITIFIADLLFFLFVTFKLYLQSTLLIFIRPILISSVLFPVILCILYIIKLIDMIIIKIFWIIVIIHIVHIHALIISAVIAF